MTDTTPEAKNFIHNLINEDTKSNKYDGRIITRFPPEPNGYLHIGHAKSICLNFGIAERFPGAVCHMRFDDTNPGKERPEYIAAIKQDVKWLGFDWGNHLYHTSDYFEKLYEFAVTLIKKDRAYVDSLSADEIREYRGTLKEAGKNSPWRERSIEENLDLFKRMRAGEFKDGELILRAKIDMASPNMNLRDPAIYRIKHMEHPLTGDDWCIYPMYDYAHSLSDAIEGITHSLCTLEFEDHRPVYDWFIREVGTEYVPTQTEFSRLNLDYTVMSKRMLNELVNEDHVSGWNDPRMPTISGLRRRGYTPAAVRDFCERVGVTRKDNTIEMGVLENCIREDLDNRAPRVMAVIDPIKLLISNYPADQVEQLTAHNHPKFPEMGTRKVPFSKELYIEREDFMEDPPKKFFRLGPGREVRLRYGYLVTCTDFVKDENGIVTEIHCTYDPETRGGNAPDGRKVKGTIHWVSAAQAVPAEVRLYDRLFDVPNPTVSKDNEDYHAHLNPHSLIVMPDAKLEPSLAKPDPTVRYQFERSGYFCTDLESSGDRLVFNRVVTLRDSWAKVNKR